MIQYFREKSLMHIVHRLALGSFSDVKMENCGVLRMTVHVPLNYNDVKPHYNIREAELVVQGKLSYIDEFLVSMEMFDVVKSIDMMKPVVNGDMANVIFVIKIHPSYLLRHGELIKRLFLYIAILPSLISLVASFMGVVGIFTAMTMSAAFLSLYLMVALTITYMVHKPLSKKKISMLKKLEHDKEKEKESETVVEGQSPVG